MVLRLLVVALIVLPMSACSDDYSEGMQIFGRECANCHSMSSTMEMLEDVKFEDRPAHLSALLRSHQVILCSEDKKRVIAVLSRPGN